MSDLGTEEIEEQTAEAIEDMAVEGADFDAEDDDNRILKQDEIDSL